MKSLVNLFILGLIVLCWSCKPEEDVIDLGTQPAPNVLKNDASTGSSVVLTQANADQTFAALNWTAADFGGKTVNYSIEMDKSGNNFTKARDIITVKGLSQTLTVEDINSALILYGASPGTPIDVEIRVRSWVDYISFPATSNVLKYTLTPYQLTFPPLYINGDAQGWNWSNAVALTSTSPGVYTGKAKFQTNGKFRFFMVPDWSIPGNEIGFSNFPASALPAEFVTGNDGDNNIQFTGLTADYNITVGLQPNSIKIELAGPPPPPEALYLVKAQTANLDDAFELKSIDSAVYEGTLMLEANTKFRIFAGRAWNAAKWGWNFFEETSDQVDDSGDDVSNVLFTGTTGWYIVTVSLPDKLIKLVATTEPSQQLYLIGDPNGWQLNDVLAMKSLGGNKFEVIAQFNQNNIFRFFKELDWAGDQVRYSTLAGGTIDTELGDGGGGDSNFKFTAASGIYKLTISLNDKTITVVPATAPKLHLIGDDQSWTPANAVNLTWLGGGKFEATTNFTNNSIFRFFANNDPAAWDWNGEQWRYNSFAKGTVDTANLGDGGGGDSNFRFIGATGSHKVTININSLVIDIE